MRLIPEQTKTAFSAEVTTLCLCWQMTRADGFVVAVTDHDRALAFENIKFDPGAAIEGGEFNSSAAMKPSQAAGRGALANEAITEADLAAGMWNGARVDVWRVNWRDPEQRLQIWSGRLSEITHGAGGYSAELVSLKADLERPVGRVYSRRCDAVLGDARCGIDLSGDHAGKTCDQRFETCRDVFANSDNFRGFPHMPGTDFVLAGPAASGNDGGKR